MIVDGVSVEATPDTAADVTLVSSSVCQVMQPSIQKSTRVTLVCEDA